MQCNLCILVLSYLFKSNYGACSALAFWFDVIFVIIHINKWSEFFVLTCRHFSFFYLRNAKKLNLKDECGASGDAGL